MPPEESELILKCEAAMKLFKIDYTRFQTALMRYGFTGKVNKRIFQFILAELNISATFDNPESPMHKLMFGEELIDKDGFFRVERLLLLGLMHCKHEHPGKQYEHFWTYLNPELDSTIPVRKIHDLLNDIKLLSITVLQRALD